MWVLQANRRMYGSSALPGRTGPRVEPRPDHAPLAAPRPFRGSRDRRARILSTHGSAGVWHRRYLDSELLLLETGAAQHRPALRRFEWNRGFGPTLRAGCPGLGSDPGVTAGAFGLALLTTLGVVFELFVVEKELLACCEDEIGAAVYTFQYAILEFHGRLPNRRWTDPAAAKRTLPSRFPVFVCCKQGARAATNGAAMNRLPKHSGKTERCHRAHAWCE